MTCTCTHLQITHQPACQVFACGCQAYRPNPTSCAWCGCPKSDHDAAPLAYCRRCTCKSYRPHTTTPTTPDPTPLEDHK